MTAGKHRRYGRHVLRMERVYVRRRRVAALILAMLAIMMGAGIGKGVTGVIGVVNNRNHVGTVRLAESGNTTSRSQERQSKQVEASGKAETKTTPISNAMGGINAVDGSAAIATTGFTLDDNSRAALDAQIANFTNSGYTASFVLTDLTTGRTLAYNADTPIYSASAIKAPFIMSLAATGTIDLGKVQQAADEQSAEIKQNIDSTLTVSDNTAYKWLVDTFDVNAFNTWSEQAGASARMTTGHGYVTTSARDMARLWTQGYGFLFQHMNSGATDVTDESLQWLSGDMTDSLNSNIHNALGGTQTVYTKAGWISGDGDLYALNDGGLVASPSGPYVLTVLTNACDRNDLLTSLIGTLDSVHSSAMHS